MRSYVKSSPIDVFRLEKIDQSGPFSGEQEIVLLLSPHRDPIDMIAGIGVSKTKFRRLSKSGWLFAWKSRDHALKFTKQGSNSAIYAAGFMWYRYTVTDYVEFPDGQVMFNPVTTNS